MNADLQPSDVFTPNQFPVEEYNVYAAREVAERSLRRAVARTEVPVIYGEYGVGKTTLMKRFFLDDERAGRLIHVLTPAGKNMDDVARIILEQLNYSVEVSGESRDRRGVETSLEAGGGFIPFVARLRGTADRES